MSASAHQLASRPPTRGGGPGPLPPATPGGRPTSALRQRPPTARRWRARIGVALGVARAPVAGWLRSRSVLLGLGLLAFVGVPLVGNDYWFSAILVPFLVLSLAALGLNLLTGYAGQLSLGSAAFMAVGAFAAYDFLLRVPHLPLLLGFALGGLTAAAVGVLFGLPSLRIKGFYLIVSTLAAQFFVEWALTKFGWFSNFNASGVITAPRLLVLGHDLGNPRGRYLLSLTVVLSMTILARNLVRSQTGRNWMAVRDMDTAAAVIGIPILETKLLAFAISSFYCGVAGALWAFAYLGTVEPHGFDLDRSFQILFIIIVGGLGSISGAFLGAAFIVLLPILMDNLAATFLSGVIDAGHLENIQKMIFGGLIIFFLIKEPAGLARSLERGWERVRRWPLVG
jgi:branched-chain amino acid transport system permease protein